MRATVSEIGQALVAKIRSGSFQGQPIRVTLAEGTETRPPAVIVTSPSIGFHALGEGWILDRTEWRLQLYSSNGREPSVGVELAFLEAVMESLADDNTLGGLVAGLHPLGMDEAVPASAERDGPPTMLRRELRIEIHH